MTPKKLEELGVRTYVLYESYIRIGPRPPIAMETVYADVLALGRIFDVTPKAEAMVTDFRKRVAAVTDRTARAKRRPRIMSDRHRRVTSRRWSGSRDLSIPSSSRTERQ